ncbi:hypothetical protein [Pseudogemmobacter faecipullorum]|uniref:Uncharacterized protein n=1 Tax=Pseudogemmobacter faecipullorum TaxID=2755041 RepID=A0ABS8CL74_9RHOB|nr:hypothetical protein [Pseudogemmobacter faecipullorum]MCB5409625.1 hypothetical protein [Pseudogemmobacter faecipullorum]
MRVFFLSLILGSLPVLAAAEADPAEPGLQQAGPEDPPTARSGVAQLAQAHELFALGQAQGDALMVLAAARMAAGVSTEPGSELKRQTSGPAAPGQAPEPVREPAEAPEFYTRALAMAGDDPLLLELIGQAPAGSSQGQSRRVFAYKADLAPGQTDSWELAVTGQDNVEIAVLGAGNQELTVSLSDASGQLHCAGSGPGSQIYCDAHPAPEGRLSLTIGNPGAAASRYLLLTNGP